MCQEWVERSDLPKEKQVQKIGIRLYEASQDALIRRQENSLVVEFECRFFLEIQFFMLDIGRELQKKAFGFTG